MRKLGPQMPFSSLSHKKIGNIPCSQVPPGASTSYPIKNVGIFQVKPLDCHSLCPKHIPLLLLNGKNPAELSFSWDFPPPQKKKISPAPLWPLHGKAFPLFQGKTQKHPVTEIFPTEPSLVSPKPFLDFLLRPKILPFAPLFPNP